MRQIEFEIHAAFCLVMGIKICRQTDTAAGGESTRKMEMGEERQTWSRHFQLGTYRHLTYDSDFGFYGGEYGYVWSGYGWEFFRCRCELV